MKKIKFFNNSFPVKIIFVICILYWFYLGCTTEVILVHDSLGYEGLGNLISNNHSLGEYLKTGPTREPLYPIFLSIAIDLGKLLSVSYQSIQIFLQILVLFGTQILMLKILRKLKINTLIIYIAILYLGISPALVNLTLSTYSEILTFPFPLIIILLSIKLWQNLQSIQDLNQRQKLQNIFTASVLGLSFAGITLIKGAFEMITLIFFVPLFIYFIVNSRRKKIPFFRTFVVLMAMFLSFSLVITSYKLANKKYNGFFVLTDRGTLALYGNTARRMKKIGISRLFAAIASVPGEKFCEKFFKKDDCVFWQVEKSDYLMDEIKMKLRDKNMTAHQKNHYFFKATIENALRNPLQLIFLIGAEGLKVFFWESSTKIGFVVYPQWIKNIFKTPLIKDGLRFLVSIMTFISFLYSLFIVWRKKIIISLNKSEYIIFNIIFFIMAFILIHSCFFIQIRYISTIAPLWIILIAYFFDRCFYKIKTSNDSGLIPQQKCNN